MSIAVEEKLIQGAKDSKKIKIGNKSVLLSKLEHSDKYQQILVEKNPELALHWQRIWDHRGLGEKFARTYDGHPEHGGNAYHLAKRYKVPKVIAPNSQARSIALQSERNEIFAELSRTRNYLKRTRG